MNFSLTGYARSVALAGSVILSGGCQGSVQRPESEGLSYTVEPPPRFCLETSRAAAMELRSHLFGADVRATMSDVDRAFYAVAHAQSYQDIAAEASRNRSRRATELDCGDIIIHYYIARDPHLTEEDRALLTDLVIGQKRLNDVLAALQRLETPPDRAPDISTVMENQARFRSFHWALRRYDNSPAYGTVLTTTYQRIADHYEGLPPAVIRYIRELRPRDLRTLYLGIRNNFDTLFSETTPAYRDYRDLVASFGSQAESMTREDWRTAFLKIDYLAQAYLFARGDDITPLVTHEASFRDYWFGFSSYFQMHDFIRMNLASESPDPFDDSHFLRELSSWRMSFLEFYRTMPPAARTNTRVVETEKWFYRLFSDLGAKTPEQYEEYRPAFDHEPIPPHTSRPVTEANLLQRVRREHTLVLSPDQLPQEWKEIAQRVRLTVPFPDQPTFHGTAFEFIRRYARTIYFTDRPGTENELGTILSSEKAIVIRVPRGARSASPYRILGIGVHETYHLAFHEEVVQRNPGMIVDLLVNERNAYAVEAQFDENAFREILEAELGNSTDAAARQERGEIAYSLTMAGTLFSTHETFFNRPSPEPAIVGASYFYAENRVRIEFANGRLGYPVDDYGVRYRIPTATPFAWRRSYPGGYSSQAQDRLPSDLRNLFELAGFTLPPPRTSPL